MMGKEQDTYRAAFIYMGTCLPWTSVSHWSTKRAPEKQGVQVGASAATKLGSMGTTPGLSPVGHTVDQCEK